MPENSKNLSFFAIVGSGKDELVLNRIRVSQTVQVDLSKEFISQAKVLLSGDLKHVGIDQLYNPDESEIYEIKNYAIKNVFVSAIKSPESVPDFELNEKEIDTIKSICGGYWNFNENSVELYFQSFNRSKIIEPKFSFLIKDNIFQKIDSRIIRLDSKLVAIYSNNNLLFSSSSIKSFLDISDYYKEATDTDVIQVLKHSKIVTEDVENTLTLTNSWMRKRFYAIKQSSVLEEVNPKEIKRRGKEFGFDVEIVKKKGKDAIQFPRERSKMRDLLKLLNEEYFVGILSHTKFETNSKRRI